MPTVPSNSPYVCFSLHLSTPPLLYNSFLRILFVFHHPLLTCSDCLLSRLFLQSTANLFQGITRAIQ
jgi:hypothetical protein